MAALLRSLGRSFGRLLALFVLSVLALQLYFAARIALMAVVDPQSTTFQRSEAWRLLVEKHQILWAQQWVDYERISPHLKRAVIASEDADFTEHSGVDWDAIERAWERNQRAEERAQRLNARIERKGTKAAPREARVVGGSTITQQLAKNLFLGSERSLARKGQEFAITLMLETLLGKRRILEIYLNSVEWGEGLFGAEAAARHYFRVPAASLGAVQAARLAVMLPAPKRFEKRPNSAYVVGRAGTIVARMGAVDPP
ncbi:transglycosylase domain-containing protein [Piscinibacter sp.]|uniref:transglycosylase domain-containing protein n=1 Tax=Piscinibacter sp. TaxID=1903157 RepID=UPI0039E2580B